MDIDSETRTAIDWLAEIMRTSANTVVLTGAGVSTASGIPDFRSRGTGLWENADPSRVASIEAFRSDPDEFWRFYSERLGALGAVEPNAAHFALASLETAGHIRGVVTQNIDRLHRKAGSEAMVEVHGSIETAECLACGWASSYDRVMDDLSRGEPVPRCRCGEALKPGVVLFGEPLPEDSFATAMEWAREAELMVVVGSSLQVWPVAGLPEITVSAGGWLAILNRDRTPFDDVAALVERSGVEVVLPRVAERLGCPVTGISDGLEI